MSTKAIHEMTLEEAQSKLTEYNTIKTIRESESKRLSYQLEKINHDTPDLLDCIRILKDRIRALEIEA